MNTETDSWPNRLTGKQTGVVTAVSFISAALLVAQCCKLRRNAISTGVQYMADLMHLIKDRAKVRQKESSFFSLFILSESLVYHNDLICYYS